MSKRHPRIQGIDWEYLEKHAPVRYRELRAELAKAALKAKPLTPEEIEAKRQKRRLAYRKGAKTEAQIREQIETAKLADKLFNRKENS